MLFSKTFSFSQISYERVPPFPHLQKSFPLISLKGSAFFSSRFKKWKWFLWVTGVEDDHDFELI